MKGIELSKYGIKTIGLTEFQGKRHTMEDVTLVEESSVFGGSMLCGVFDGHGGKKVAEFAAKNIKSLLEEHLGEKYIFQNPIERIQNAFLNIDEGLKASTPERVYMANSYPGSTCNLCIINKNLVICANLGDSRAVLSKNGVAVPLSSDHKPDLEKEKDRIVKAGGYVTYASGAARVNGTLAVSRAFGDFLYKDNKKISPKDQAVTCLPDVKIFKKDADTKFIIIACDGLWDVLSNQEAVNYVFECVYRGIVADDVSAHLVKKAYSKGSSDNISCLVVFF